MIIRLKLIIGMVIAAFLLPNGSGLAFDYDRLQTKPLPVEEIAGSPFKFAPSEKHRKGVLPDWSKVILQENKKATFLGPDLYVDDPVLAKAWREMYNKTYWAGRARQVANVNHFVNCFDYGEDIQVWGVRDYWATPRQFFEKKVGDCKAMAIAKYYALRAMNVPAEDMYLLTVSDPTAPKGAFHLVLAVLDGDDLYVMDMDPKRGPTLNSAYRKYTVYDYFNEFTCREVIK